LPFFIFNIAFSFTKKEETGIIDSSIVWLKYNPEQFKNSLNLSFNSNNISSSLAYSISSYPSAVKNSLLRRDLIK
jgi:hypothetical protein